MCSSKAKAGLAQTHNRVDGNLSLTTENECISLPIACGDEPVAKIKFILLSEGRRPGEADQLRLAHGVSSLIVWLIVGFSHTQLQVVMLIDLG